MTVYPSQPIRVNLIVMAFMLLAVLLIMHISDRRAGGE